MRQLTQTFVMPIVLFNLVGCGMFGSGGDDSTPAARIACKDGFRIDKTETACVPDLSENAKSPLAKTAEPTQLAIQDALAKAEAEKKAAAKAAQKAPVLTPPLVCDPGQILSEDEAQCVTLPTCQPNQTLNRDTLTCEQNPPSEEECLSQNQLLNDERTACRSKMFVDWCNDPESDYEASKTVSRILNTLDLTDCQDALRKLETAGVLDLSRRGQKISDLAPIGSLYGLTVLKLPNNDIYDLSPLQNLRNLKVLDLRNNAIQDISPIVGLSELNKLDISGNEVRDHAPLLKLKKLLRVTVDPAHALPAQGAAFKTVVRSELLPQPLTAD